MRYKGFTACQIKDLFSRYAPNGGSERLRLDGFANANPSALLLSDLFHKFVRSLCSQRRHRNASGRLNARPLHRLTPSSTPVVGSCPQSAYALNSSFAFTLAEVLITLAIIGVVAALTVPTVIRNYQERQTVTALKKFYTEISQAYARAQVNNSTPDTWNWGTASGSAANADKIIDILAPYLKITKRCGTVGGCFSPDTYKTLNPNVNWWGPSSSGYGYATAQLANGLAFWVLSYGNNCTQSWGSTKELGSICGAVGVDLNGFKKPNQLGRDTFYFWITKYNIIPMGTKDDNAFPLSSRCKTSSQNENNGYACTAWIIAKDNMDYLHKDVSW